MFRAFVAVFWSFLGIRKDSEYQTDITQLSFGQIVVAGVICTLLFIASLVGVVYLVTH
ncbi:MAG: DUF2970 domain-containing protein [Pseudomonadota bacterium]|nr:DUF2970 domain-containing protein [Pseudomonadota bacterium]